MLDLSTATTLVKNSLVDTGSWVILITLTSPDLINVIRICSNTEDIVYDNFTFAAFPFDIEEITQSTKGQLPTVNLKVSNINRLVQSYVEQDATLGSNWEVYLQVVHSSNTQNYLTYSTDFSKDVWTLADATIYKGTTEEFIDPFGLISATELIADGIGSDAKISQTYDLTNKASFTNSIYVKQNSNDLQFNLEIYDQTNIATLYSVNLDLTSGVLTFLGTEVGTGVINIEETDYGYYKVTMTVSDLVAVGIVEFITRASLVNTVTTNRLLIAAPQVSDSPLQYTPTDALPLTDGIISEPELDIKFISLSTTADTEWVTFQIGMANPLRMQVPRTKYIANHCQHTYMQGGCIYAGALPSCDKDITDCQAHFPTLGYLPILAFPGIASVAIYE